MRAIINRGLYIFYPILKDHFFVFKEIFLENSVLMYGLYSRAASNQERPMMARVRYLRVSNLKKKMDIFSNFLAYSKSEPCHTCLLSWSPCSPCLLGR